MKRTQQKQRFALTLLFSLVISINLLLTIGIVGIVIYLLIQAKVLTDADHSPPSAPAVIIITVISNLTVGCLLSLLIGHIPTKPVNILIDKMNRLASGDFKVRINKAHFFAKHKSIAELTDSFNTMAEELEHTEMLRSDFINNFSHEFKTPIVSIAGFAKLLKRGNLTEQQKMEYLDIIEEESLRLSAMATNVLNLTRVENQTILTDITKFNLSEQLRACVLLLESKWAKKNLEFSMEFPEYYISANEELLKQVWINLLDNAIKFSPEYSTIEIHPDESDDVLTVLIRNFGIEIAKDQQDRIFNKFYQADESHSSEGNGIGLALVRRIAVLHGGTVSVMSEQGVTDFMVTLPKFS